MYSTTNSAAHYSMVPQAMIFRPKGAADDWTPAVSPTQFRQWVRLERYAGKRDYVTVTTKDLAEVWGGITDRGARKALYGLEESGWVVVDDRTGKASHSRIWLPWYPVTNEMVEDDDFAVVDDWTNERYPGPLVTARQYFLMNAERNVQERQIHGPGFANPRARSMREAAMGAKGTENPYVHLPAEVINHGDLKAADVLVWTAMQDFGPKVFAAQATIAEKVGIKDRQVRMSVKALTDTGLIIPTGKTAAGTKVYTVPEHLTGKKRAGKASPVLVGSET
jgi:hypothetical protein